VPIIKYVNKRFFIRVQEKAWRNYIKAVAIEENDCDDVSDGSDCDDTNEYVNKKKIRIV